NPEDDNSNNNSSNLHINVFFDLGFYDIDINYDWVGVCRQWYPNFESADNFIQHFCDNAAVSEIETDIIINRKTLNKKQKLSQASKNREKNLYENDSPLLLILATTGVAVFNINSATIHSVLSISIATKDVELTEDIDKFNKNKLYMLNHPVARIRAIYSRGSEAQKADLNEAKGLESEILLAKDQPLPLLKVLELFQLALYNAHGMGLILPKAIIDLGQNEFVAGLLFVAVSHIRLLNNIIFKPFIFERLQYIKNVKDFESRFLKKNSY
ncbi:7430_t:CDS:2, partial [Racocetra persica]